METRRTTMSGYLHDFAPKSGNTKTDDKHANKKVKKLQQPTSMLKISVRRYMDGTDQNTHTSDDCFRNFK